MILELIIITLIVLIIIFFVVKFLATRKLNKLRRNYDVTDNKTKSPEEIGQPFRRDRPRREHISNEERDGELGIPEHGFEQLGKSKGRSILQDDANIQDGRTVKNPKWDWPEFE